MLFFNDEMQRKLPCEDSCIQNDDDRHFTQTDRIIILSFIFGGMALGVAWGVWRACGRPFCNDRNTSIREPLVESTASSSGPTMV